MRGFLYINFMRRISDTSTFPHKFLRWVSHPLKFQFHSLTMLKSKRTLRKERALCDRWQIDGWYSSHRTFMATREQLEPAFVRSIFYCLLRTRHGRCRVLRFIVKERKKKSHKAFSLCFHHSFSLFMNGYEMSVSDGEGREWLDSS